MPIMPSMAFDYVPIDFFSRLKLYGSQFHQHYSYIKTDLYFCFLKPLLKNPIDFQSPPKPLPQYPICHPRTPLLAHPELYIMFDKAPHTPQKDPSRYTSYRQKRAQSRNHISSSITNTKALEEIEQTLKSNLQRRQAPLSANHPPHIQPFERLPPEELSAKKLIEKYSKTVGIAEVAEEDMFLLSSRREMAGKEVGLGQAPVRVVRKNSSIMAEKSTPQPSTKYLHDKNTRAQTAKTNGSFGQERRTIGKTVKATINSSIKTEKKVEKRPGLGLCQQTLTTQQVPNSKLQKLIPKVEALKDEILRGAGPEKATHLAFHFSNILELLRQG